MKQLIINADDFGLHPLINKEELLRVTAKVSLPVLR